MYRIEWRAPVHNDVRLYILVCTDSTEWKWKRATILVEWFYWRTVPSTGRIEIGGESLV